ncbi:MAG: hypothetical protein EP343_16755 [Deltaproteobacteria bacterium]|nr:MAG: hypothetical protein EP343_16755 [Deltaproteobacteria bacterium]
MVMTEDERQGQGIIPVQWCKDHRTKYKFSFDVLKDAGSEQLRQYFDRNAVPLNMIITTKNMKIVYKKSGALESRLEGIVESYVR